MIERVLDASVAAAWYLPESFATEARRWRTDLLSGQVRLLVPSLHYLEIANVFRTYVRRGELSRELAIEAYEAHLEAPIEVADPSRGAILSTALDYEATAYDAAYIALTLERQVPLLTAERTTSPWIVRLGKLADPLRA